MTTTAQWLPTLLSQTHKQATIKSWFLCLFLVSSLEPVVSILTSSIDPLSITHDLPQSVVLPGHYSNVHRKPFFPHQSLFSFVREPKAHFSKLSASPQKSVHLALALPSTPSTPSLLNTYILTQAQFQILASRLFDIQSVFSVMNLLAFTMTNTTALTMPWPSFYCYVYQNDL